MSSEQQAAAEAREAQYNELDRIKSDTREAQKAYIDRWKRLPPTSYNFFGHDDSEFSSILTRIAMANAYLVFLREEHP
jgi:hypothetical protein